MKRNRHLFPQFIIAIGFFLLPFIANAQNNLISDVAGCSAAKQPFSFNATPVWTTQTGTTVPSINTPLVGDLDGDGKAEVVTLNYPATTTVQIFNGADGTSAGTISVGSNIGNTHINPTLLCNIGGKGHIFIAGYNGSIYLYKVTSAPGVRPITFSQEWTKAVPTGSGYYVTTMPVVGDLDGDGVVEFVAGNKIIDSRNGDVLATLLTNGTGPFSSFPLLAEMDNDGHPEIIVGANIYKYNGGSSVTLWKTCPGMTTATEGTNMVGDINGDGALDVAFVQNIGDNVPGTTIVTVWTPATGATLGTINLGTARNWVSYPFVADIDGKVETSGKKYLEVVVNTVNNLKAYSYTGSGFTPKWTLAHTDASGATSLTLFDFNNNGTVELVYRDQNNIRIFDGSGSSPAVISGGTFTCGSGTLSEAPVIADVTGSGSASIIVCGNPTMSGNNGEVMVFGGGSSPWVSAPKVWNQQLYSPLLVNQDLTIPTTVKSPLLTYTNCNSTQVQMYNGGPMQAPIVSETTYCVIDQAPDVYVISAGSSINVAGSLVTFTIKVGNRGSATATANTPVYFYRDAILNNAANKLGMITLGSTIGVGETITITKSFTVGATAVNYFARLMDDGVAFPAAGAFSDCDISNNTLGLVSEPPAGFTATSTLFSDDVWFFGKNPLSTPTDGKSPGIQFKGTTPIDLSGKSMVSSVENSLSVSTPACDGGFVFYTSHDHVYNSQHQPMKGGIAPGTDPGKFYGNNSVCDGLASCYIGDNKYYLFSVTSAYEVLGVPIAFYSYIVDMSADNGQGELSSGTVIESTGMSESVELIPVPNTYDEYWLVYYHRGRQTMEVSKVTPSGLTSPQTLNFPIAVGVTYQLKRNGSNNRLALVGNNGNIYLFHFDPYTGTLSTDHTVATGFPIPPSTSPNAYGVEFSPGGKYLYATTWNGNLLLQYSLETFQKITGTYNTIGAGGGGLKLGADGKIYIPRNSNNKYVGVIKTPDVPMTISTAFYDMAGFELSLAYTGLALSTGLTPPAIDPPSSSQPPQTTPDAGTTTNAASITILPLANDTDPQGADIFLISAGFVNAADAATGTISINTTTKAVTFTPSLTYSFTDGQQVELKYRVKNNAIPIGLCSDNGRIMITIRLAKLGITLSSPSVDEGNSVTATVCMPAGTAAPAGGLVVNLVREATSTAATTDYSMSPVTTATIPAGDPPCVTFTINAATDDLLEGNELLKLQATATNFIISDIAELTITDRTIGDIIVEKVNDASEPGTPGKYRIRFKDLAVSCPRPVKVTYSYGGAAIGGTDYTQNTPAEAIIPATQNGVDVMVPPVNNFKVEGSREVIITILSAVKQ